MDRKQVQKDRVRRYFLDAAKAIIRAEGIANLTTQKVGEGAAYSYASIYNYFENFNDLVCQCLEEIAAEVSAWVAQRLEGLDPRQRVLDFAALMVEANAKEPNVYSIFLSTSIDYSYFQRRDGHHFMHPAYAMLLRELGQLPALKDPARSEDLRILADILTSLFHSKLDFYIRYGSPGSLEALYSEVEEETRFLLDRL